MSKKFDSYSDEELFELIGKRNRYSDKAFAVLYERYSSRVYAYCRRFLSSPERAQDVFQETFIRFHKSATPDRVMTNVPAFLLRIARNLSVNELRKEKSHTMYEDYMVGTNDPHVSGNKELLELIHNAIDELPEKYREMFILREYDGLSYADIADVTDETVATVKVRIHRAKQKIREILMPYIKDLEKHDN